MVVDRNFHVKRLKIISVNLRQRPLFYILKDFRPSLVFVCWNKKLILILEKINLKGKTSVRTYK